MVVGLHGMNDYAAAFGLAGPYWAARGVTTYAYDQRGFGRGAQRGVWGGEALMDADLRTATALVRAQPSKRHRRRGGREHGGRGGDQRLRLRHAAGRRPAGAGLARGLGVARAGPAEQRGAVDFRPRGPRVAADGAGLAGRRIRASDNLAELRRMGLDPNMIFATRIDTVYGLVELMQHAQDEVGETKVPTLYQYGAHDDIIPKHAAFRAARHLNAGDRSAYYATGYHLLLRDLHRRVVLDDVLAFVRDPRRPAPPAPRRSLDARRAPPPAALPAELAAAARGVAPTRRRHLLPDQRGRARACGAGPQVPG